MTKALVTGVAGFIGSHVAEQCLKLGFEVVGVDDLSGGTLSNIPEGVDFRQGTVTNGDWIKHLWDNVSYDYVYHLAAYAAEGLSHFIRRYNYQTNLLGSINLINESILHHVKCFVFTSSIAVYGSSQIPMVEALAPHPEDPYGVSKYAVELDLQAANAMFELPYIIFRPHNVYGERQNIADRYRNVVGIFMNQVMSGKAMSIFGDGLQTRAFSYVGDVASVIARAPLTQQAYGEVFNVGAENPYTILELAEEVAHVFDIAPQIEYLPARTEVRHAVASHEKIHRFFDLPESTPLSTGLHRMAAWAKDHGPCQPVEFDNIEVPVNLPSSWQ
jgi:UDP-glucose 4-epimerase